MSGMSATPQEGAPHNLTHCCDCDQPFSDPVEAWDDYFTDLEDASFACRECGDQMGYPDAD